jgi:hypothetical protein
MKAEAEGSMWKKGFSSVRMTGGKFPQLEEFDPTPTKESKKNRLKANTSDLMQE